MAAGPSAALAFALSELPGQLPTPSSPSRLRGSRTFAVPEPTCIVKRPGCSLQLLVSVGATSAWVQRRRHQRRRARVARLAAEDSGTWILPSVDKDVGEFHRGHGPDYAWVQTSETLYIFSPMPEKTNTSDGLQEPPQVVLDIQNEGSTIRLVVEGKEILNGSLAHAVKPGEQIWMVEDAPDGREFTVCELDKMTLGIEWTSVLRPQASMLTDYSKPVVEALDVTEDAEVSTVEATLQHLRAEKRKLQPADQGHAAVTGDVLTIDMQGYALAEDGGRGEQLEIGSAKDVQMELGAPGFSREIQDSLVGITVDETRDVKVSLGNSAGEMGGQQIICAATCKKIEEQRLPELDDDFAKAIKQDDLFKQAGTPEGISDEEAEKAKTFTLSDLKEEISQEVRQSVQTEVESSIDAQLRLHLRQSIKVTCDWAVLPAERIEEEGLACGAHTLAEREGLMSNIDMDRVVKLTWDKLGEPDPGEASKQVGNDPARDYQAAHREILREHVMNQALTWLRQRMELVAAGEGQ